MNTPIQLFAGLFMAFAVLGYSSASEILLSSSHGIYALGATKPLFQKLTREGEALTAFKTVYLSESEVLTAWGSGRNPVRSKNENIASLERINIHDPNIRTTLISTPGKRIRDFIVDGNNIVAVGHDKGDVHILSLSSGRHKVIHLERYDSAICHAVEKADLDHNGQNEYYITLTSPNSSGGLGQQGQLVRLDVDWKTFSTSTKVIIDAYKEYGSYIKEIAIVDTNSDGISELLAQVLPQIEVYGKNDIQFIEPMRLVLIDFDSDEYRKNILAEANIRLGRNISYNDIDNDQKREIYFIDYYQTGFYILEQKSERIYAEGEQVNRIESSWQLTRVKSYDSNGMLSPNALRLSSNQTVFIKNAKFSNNENVLLALSDNFTLQKNEGNLRSSIRAPMSVRILKVLRSGNTYSLENIKLIPVHALGELWHINSPSTIKGSN